ncbi:DinB family protein [Actinoplanes sp. NPDC051411]|uniref:DinB family protein n=1 Tax=Actinoplanes sp. NPDC051411 TaxID=3155522 RepID=UPI003438D158
MTYPPLNADERTTLTAFLDAYRADVLSRLDRVTPAQAAARLLAGTDMTIGGIVKHLAQMEDLWFTHKLLGRDFPAPWPGSEEQWAWTSAASDSLDSLRELYTAACDRSRAAVASLDDLDDRAELISFGTDHVNLRWMLVHMISETAQHAGHLDLLLDAL